MEIALSWPDGLALLGSAGSRSSTDWEILTRYFPQNRLLPDKVWSPQAFYESVYAPPIEEPIPKILDARILESDLYPFQKRAVNWMLRREGIILEAGGAETNGTEEISRSESGSHLTAISTVDDVSYLSFRTYKDARDGEVFVSHLQGAVASRSFLDNLPEPRGGILAEEMGLGKTCELISLILLNKRSETTQADFLGTDNKLRKSKATLIVTPASILEQWKYELAKHAPHLTWMHYQGMRTIGKSGQEESELVDAFANKDVVLTTYAVLSGEVHFAVNPPERSLRKRTAEKAPRPRSPLVQTDWWRVCLDEAQMVESGVSNAATVAALLPRQNAWAVSGTPVKKDIQDLRGLLIFLRYQPFADSGDIWKRLVNVYEDDFRKLFGRIALRHTKDRIRQELRLPPQRRIVITVPFTTVEEQNYKTLFEEMAAEVGCATDG